MKLQAKILLILVPLAALPLLLLGWLTYSELTTNTRQQALKTLEILTDETAEELRLDIREVTSIAKILAESKLLDKFLNNINPYEKYNVLRPDLVEFYAHYIHIHPEILAVKIRAADGSTMLDVPLENQELVGEAKEQIRSDTNISFFNSSSGQLLYSRTIKLFSKDSSPLDDDRKILGYLDIVASLNTIDDVIKTAYQNQSGAIFFTDEYGKIIREAKELSLTGTIELPEVSKLISGHWEVPSQKIEVKDQTFYIHGQQIHQHLYLFSLLPNAQVISNNATYFRHMAGIIAISVALFTILGFLAIRTFLIKPIQALGTAAQEIGQGNLSSSLEINSHDELGDLSNSLKEMSRNLRQSNEQIRYFAYHDSLTRLPNRLLFNEYLDHALAYAKRHHQSLALMYLDLDDFKVINDTLGHQAGDEVLCQVSERLSECLREEDYLGKNQKSESFTYPDEKKQLTRLESVARLGGDEFTILLPDINNPYEAATVANRVLQSLEMPFIFKKRELHVRASIGITTYPRDGVDSETLIKNADMAMYHAKEKGKSAYSYYQNSMNEAAFELLDVQNEMRKALVRDEFILHYQPQIDLNTGHIIGLEALIRWNHPEKGLLLPDRFIPTAELSELIVPIGEWVIQSACRQIKQWHNMGFSDLCVSVNVSPAQLHRHNLVEVIQDSLSINRIPAEALEIELTETALCSSEQVVFETLSEIRQLGVKVAMDDFGTGYSSLSYLSKLPIDRIKIDRSFVSDINSENTHAPIIAAIIAMANSLDLPVTAEGVELEAQVNFLKNKGCAVMQGFLISQPVRVEEVVMQLKSQESIKKFSHRPLETSLAE